MYLFPHRFRTIGWAMFAVGIILGSLLFFGVIEVGGDFLHVSVEETILNDVAIIGTTLGALFVVNSRERKEDELTQLVRLTSLLYALYGYLGVLILCTLLFNGFEFLIFSLVYLVFFPIIYVVMFSINMQRLKMLGSDEE
ncbi:MAG: hypothetical protein K2M53_06660, partial [Muribaculaceae bacterium]|nr:hypothetical protein [Muribaculaceae bacterium]